MRYRHLPALLVAACCVLSVACVDAPASPMELSPQFAKGGNGNGNGGGGPPGGGETDPATVSFADDLGDGISSDGLGRYVDGVDRVEVRIAEADFNFKPRTHRKGDRGIWLELGTPIEAGDTVPFTTGPMYLDRGDDFRIHDGLLGVQCGEAAVQQGRLFYGPGDGVGDTDFHRLSFGVPGRGGDPLSISRAGDSIASTWTITPTGVGRVERGTVYAGTYAVAFTMTVTGPGCDGG